MDIHRRCGTDTLCLPKKSAFREICAEIRDIYRRGIVGRRHSKVAPRAAVILTDSNVEVGGQALVVISSLSRKATPMPGLLQRLFDLTAAEARLVVELATGMMLRDITEARHVSMATLRTQMRAVLAKTGMPRFTDLSHLLARIPSSH